MKLAYFLCILLFFACSEKPEEKVEVDWNKEKSTAINKIVAENENRQILMYLENRPNWKMTETGTGLRYQIYHEGTGIQAETNMTAEVSVKIFLLDGTKCYETAEDEVEVFKIDKSDVESGLQEGVKKMKVGDKARMIIPSHLAFGLLGDFDNIPPLATLVVHVELFSLY